MKLFDTFLIRTPLLPVQSETDDPWDAFRNSVLIREAIFLSSRTLYDRIEDVLTGKETKPDKILKIEQSLGKYLIRLTSRSTPFGINGLLSFARFDNQTALRVADTPIQRTIRFDMHFLTRFYDTVIQDTNVIRELRWFSNNTLFEFNGTYRYIEYSTETGERVHQLSQVKIDKVLTIIVNLARKGTTIAELTQRLQKEQFSSSEVAAYLEALIAGKILTSELEPMISGELYSRRLAAFFQRHPKLKSPLVDAFVQSEALLNDAKDVNTYKTIEATLAAVMGPGISTLRVDAFRQLSEGTLDKSIFDALPDALKICNHYTRHIKSNAQTNLDAFISEFVRRYEGQELPLSFVLDPDLSIGYPYADERAIGDEIYSGLAWNSELMMVYEVRDRFQQIVDKYYDCVAQHKDEIEFTEAECHALVGGSTLPSAILATMASLIPTPQGVEVFHTATEPLGPAAIARFSGLDPQLLAMTQQLADEEHQHYQKENALVAELVFLPSERGSNVVVKPHLRQYEIPIICQSQLTGDHIIPVNDIMIRIVGGQIVLKSASKGVVIIPKFTSIFNQLHCKLPIYNFFYDLRGSTTTGALNWNWSFLAKMPFQPRVRYKNIVLSKATWIVESGSFPETASTNAGLRQYLQRRRIPQHVSISTGDDVAMYLNFEDDDDIALFRAELKKFHRLQLSEDPHTHSECLVQSNQGGHANEVIVHWNNLTPGPQFVFRKQPGKNTSTFVPGQEWIYVSLFCNQKTADTILRLHIAKLIDLLSKRNMIDTWFFIRYGDPRYHIRLRIKPKPVVYEQVENELRKMLGKVFRDRFAWDIKQETYMREIQRYGDLNITATEKLFQADSELMLGVLKTFNDGDLSGLRWKIAAISIHHLLDDFHVSLAERVVIMKRLTESFFAEQRVTGKAQISWLKDNFRSKKSELNDLLAGNDQTVLGFIPVLSVRSGKIRILTKKINKNLREEELKLEDILPSYLHMLMNRLFVSQHRRQEMIVYDLLHQHYAAAANRAAHAGRS